MRNRTEEKQMCTEVGKRLSELRKAKNMTQNQAAEHLGITQGNMSQLESDARKISIYSIKKLIELYNSTYESVLGKLGGSNGDAFFEPNSIASIDLLLSICNQADSEELNLAVTAYINMCVYIILRELYEANPRNTDAVFSLQRDDALKKATDFISKTPYHLSAFINASSGGRIKKKSIEPPLEKAADFREFISSCEDYISKYLSNNQY